MSKDQDRMRSFLEELIYSALDYDGDETLSRHLADVLITELGLRVERQQGPYSFMYRYSTDLREDKP